MIQGAWEIREYAYSLGSLHNPWPVREYEYFLGNLQTPWGVCQTRNQDLVQGGADVSRSPRYTPTKNEKLPGLPKPSVSMHNTREFVNFLGSNYSYSLTGQGLCKLPREYAYSLISQTSCNIYVVGIWWNLRFHEMSRHSVACRQRLKSS